MSAHRKQLSTKGLGRVLILTLFEGRTPTRSTLLAHILVHGISVAHIQSEGLEVWSSGDDPLSLWFGSAAFELAEGERETVLKWLAEVGATVKPIPRYGAEAPAAEVSP